MRPRQLYAESLLFTTLRAGTGFADVGSTFSAVGDQAHFFTFVGLHRFFFFAATTPQSLQR
jgi:hypothetical protein